MVDLAIGHFEITNGLVTFAAQKYEFNARGNNLRAQLSYSTLRAEYRGQISLQPRLSRFRPEYARRSHCSASPPSGAQPNRSPRRRASHRPCPTLALDASLRDLQNPHVSAHVSGRIALADLQRAGNLPLNSSAHNLPSALDLDANATGRAGSSIQVTGLRLTLGRSSLEASGPLDRGLDFKSRLSLNELAGLAGVININGKRQARC